MEFTNKRTWIDHIWKLPRIGAILAVFAIITPASNIMESGVFVFLWYFGFWFLTSGGVTDFGMASDFFAPPFHIRYMTIGITTIALLIISLILMSFAVTNAKDKMNHKIAAVTSFIGGLLALIGIGAYYVYMTQEFSSFWVLFNPGIGFYLPLIAGIAGIIGGIASVAAFSLESKLPGVRVMGEPIFKPQSIVPPTIQTGVSIRKQKFCRNCGTELIGIFCKECGTKA